MKRDIEFLHEIGALRYIQRQWHRFNGIDFANLSEHHFRVAWIALTIAKHEGVKNTDKILKMALCHDIPESRTGDVDYLARQYVKRDEESGLNDMLEGTSISEEISAIWHEYEKRECIEARIVKDADNLDIDFELREQAANGIVIKNWDIYRKHVGDNFLFTDTAKRMVKLLPSVDPHDWHVESPKNRIKGGDWKKPNKTTKGK
jgi:putative hydrolases of HD superfamily